MSLETITEKLSEKVTSGGGIPGKVVIFDFGSDGLVAIDSSVTPPTVHNNDGNADCRIKVSMADFEDIATGKQNPQMAFMMGKLKVEGDMSIALQLSKLLG